MWIIYLIIYLLLLGRNNIAMLKDLIHHGGKINLNNPEWNRHMKGASPLHTAARYGRTENAICLLEMLAVTDITDAAGQTPLHIAAAHEISGKQKTLRQLISPFSCILHM